MVQQCCPGNAAARIMSWLVLLHLKAASQLSCLQPGVSRLPGTRSDELTRTNGCTDFQYTQASRGCPLHSQYFFLSTSQSLALCFTLCVWCGKVLILGLIFACSSAHTPFSTSTLSAITVNQSRSGYLQLTLATHLPLSLTTSLAPRLSPTLTPRLPPSPRMIRNKNKCSEFDLNLLDSRSRLNTLPMHPYKPAQF